MDISNTDGYPPFLPSKVLAQLALQAVEDRSSFSPMFSALAVAPEGFEGSEHENLLELVRKSIGTRIDRLFASLGEEAAESGLRELPVWNGERFTPLIEKEVIEALTLVREDAGPFLSRLQDELRGEARARRFGGDYGQLMEEGSRLVLTLSPFESQEPADRPRARLIGGTALGEPG
jgi:hypothetical protein